MRGVESRRLLPVFATRRGLGVEEAEGATGSEAEPEAALSPGFEGPAPLAARNVLFTETALKEVSFLTVEVLRTWPFSSPWPFDVSAFEVSVSDPPLTLTSAELMIASVRSDSNLDSSFAYSPFTRGSSLSTF